LSDSRILWAFGLVAIIGLASSVFFRRHSLGTGGRVALSAVAVLLVLVPPFLRGELGWRHGAAALVMAVVLGAGVLSLRAGATPPPEE
jgi:hypothetical protein